MRVRELTEDAISAGLLERSNGKTPHQTMKAKLSVDIKRLGNRSRFKRSGVGLFALREFDDPEYVAPPIEKTIGKENVLVFPSATLKRAGWFHGIRRDAEKFASVLLNPRNTEFLPRLEAESNLAFKQVVSYVLIRRKGAILRFVRGSYNSAQTFLRGSYCIGFGGHVQASDLTLFDQEDSGYITGLLRELNEELKLPQPALSEDRLQLVAVLNDDSSILGKLHFAFVHLLDLEDLDDFPSPRSLKREKSINQLRFVPITKLGDEFERYEYWSKLCIQELFKLAVNIRCRIHAVRNFKLSLHSKHIIVVGTIGSGKTELCNLLQDHFGYHLISTGQMLQRILGTDIRRVGRSRMQTLAQSFIEGPNGPRILADGIADAVLDGKRRRYVIDGIRNIRTFDLLRTRLGSDAALVYVDSTIDNAYRFYRTREIRTLQFEEFVALVQHPVELEIPQFSRIANIIIYNHGSKRSYVDAITGYLKEELAWQA
jgi:predicted NUDIX family phosphoesterase/dephospho-CoA kinase